ncbi:DUF6470 family protein [Paenibacillus larvae]|uniref:DUF6470 family protein n=1 Tax=Paenibacillus larvae TaxID=1464 RepID=UPI00016936E0
MIPMIAMHQEHGRIGMNTEPGQYEIRQHQADMQIKTTPAHVEIRSPKPEMYIDQSKAWEALNGGKLVPFLNHIYSQTPQIVLQAIANIVERGNRLPAFHKGNAIADIGTEWRNGRSKIDYLGPASSNNVDIYFVVNEKQKDVVEGDFQLQVRVNKPEIKYHSGELSIWLEKYPSLTITPPVVDLKA